MPGQEVEEPIIEKTREAFISSMAKYHEAKVAGDNEALGILSELVEICWVNLDNVLV